MHARANIEHSSVDQSFLTKTDKSTECGWKGTASYYNINIDGMSAEMSYMMLLVNPCQGKS